MAETDGTHGQLQVVSHLLSVAIGVTAIGAALAAFHAGLTSVVGISLLIVGGLAVVLSYYSFQGSRAAWSFLIALMAVCGGVDFFGSPKIRDVLGIHLGFAMVIPVVHWSAVSMLYMLRRDYRET